MYNVGFGDAFLLVLPGPDRPRRMLVDCGSHASGPGPRPMAEVVESIIADVTDADGVARIDVVVGTHRHRDHVSGFANAAWGDVEVREVWMPWTEDPRDPEAKRIRERQAGLAQALTLALAAAGDDDPAKALAENALPNAPAMRTLHHGFAGNPKRRFLPRTTGVVTRIVSSSLRAAGIEVHALGPAHDESVIRDMDPPAGAGYLRLGDATGPEAFRSPFGEEWTITSRELAARARLKPLLLTRIERAQVNASAESDAFAIAVALEKAINGTSLVLALRQRGASLILPADAQWGTWKRMLDSPEAVELLQSATFVKVGHHGSHNATPRAFVELLAAGCAGAPVDDLWAMVSTRTMAMWKQIPKPELMSAIGDVTPQFARSDEGAQGAPAGFADASAEHIDAHIPL
jgi:beta-lactamase superfamily II metal-dependent hydrolase